MLTRVLTSDPEEYHVYIRILSHWKKDRWFKWVAGEHAKLSALLDHFGGAAALSFSLGKCNVKHAIVSLCNVARHLQCQLLQCAQFCSTPHCAKIYAVFILLKGALQHFLNMVGKCCRSVVKAPTNMWAKYYSAACGRECTIKFQGQLEIAHSSLGKWSSRLVSTASHARGHGHWLNWTSWAA